ncbi:MAG: hypothetical protein R3F65_08660 [bacterium]
MSEFKVQPFDGEVWPSDDGKVNEYTIKVGGSPIGSVFITGGSMSNGWADNAQYWAWSNSTTAWSDYIEITYTQQKDPGDLSPPSGSLVHTYEEANFGSATAALNLTGNLNNYKVEVGSTTVGYVAASTGALRAWRVAASGDTMASKTQTTNWSKDTTATGTYAYIEDKAI